MKAEAERWPLPSGTWVRNDEKSGYRLILTAGGTDVSDRLSDEDIACLIGAHCQGGPDSPVFPPEFSFSPQSGAQLKPYRDIVSQGWVPPYGASLLHVKKRNDHAVRGLDVTGATLLLPNADQRRPTDDAEVIMPTPPPGSYEFITTQASSTSTALFALESSKGTIYAWLPATKRWVEVEHESGGGLAHWSRSQSKWECEIVAEDNRSRIFAPTIYGLGCIDLNVMSLTFSVKYFGNGEALAAPLCWIDQIWVPVSSNRQELALVAVDIMGEMSLRLKVPNCPAGDEFRTPVCNERILIWPGKLGQLLVQKKPDGSFEAAHLPWPDGLIPAFEFGCPYISREGAFWQICWDANGGNYVYLQLGTQNPERHEASSPRLCTGHVTYRFLKPMRLDPWIDPPQGDDAMNDRYLLPVLESTKNRAFFGLEIQTIKGLQSILETTERQRVVLVIGDDTKTVRFHTVTMPEPRKSRLFLHEDKLWIYHPALEQILGWRTTT